MKTSIAFFHPTAPLGLLALLATVMVLPVAQGQNTNRSTPSIPVIQMDNVPLTDAIRNLARQTGRNYILDPRLASPQPGADGREPCITRRWENLTPNQALMRLLSEQGLTWIDNPATSIARIGLTNTGIKPVPASAVGSGNNPIIPLIGLDSVPLTDAIKNLAREAHLEYSLDPELPMPFAGPGRRTLSRCELNARWENVSARQALVALLDNYELALVQTPGSSSFRIVPKAKEP